MLGVGVLAGAIGLNWGHAFRRAFAALPRRDAIFLLLGAAIICGCFFAVQNIVYRGVFMLLTLPGLMKLANSDMPPALRRVVAATLVAVLYVLWNFTLQQVVYATTGVVLRPITNGPIIAYLYWLSQQLAIWWVVATLLAVLASFALHSTAVRALFAARRRPSPA